MVSSVTDLLYHLLDITFVAWIQTDAFIVLFSMLIIGIVIKFVITLFKH